MLEQAAIFNFKRTKGILFPFSWEKSSVVGFCRWALINYRKTFEMWSYYHNFAHWWSIIKCSHHQQSEPDKPFSVVKLWLSFMSVRHLQHCSPVSQTWLFSSLSYNNQCMYLAIKLAVLRCISGALKKLPFALYLSQGGLTCFGISHFPRLQTGLEKTSSYLISDYSFFLTRNYKQHVLKSRALSCLYHILTLRQK